MKTHQTAVISGVVFLAVVAIVTGDLLIHRYVAFHGEPQSTRGSGELAATSLDETQIFHKEMPGFVSNDEQQTDVDHLFSASGKWSHREGDVAVLSGEDIRTPERDHPAPDEFRSPENVTPIRPNELVEEATIRRLIKENLPDITAVERSVWLDQLKGMTLSEISDVLSLRRRFGPLLPPSVAGTEANDAAKPQAGRDRVFQPRVPRRARAHHLGSTSLRPFRKFQNTLAGLRLAQEVVLNNIANANTVGFKRSQIRFEDLAYQYRKLPGAQDIQGNLSPIGLHVGLGSRVAGTVVDHRQGSLIETGGILDIAIVGDGFFQIQDGDEILYTRSGTFTKNADGNIVLASADRGRLLEPTITIPQDATDIVITSEGSVSVRQAGSQQLTSLGQIQLARFVNPQGLIQRGDNLYGLSDASGQPLLGTPGTDGRGELRSGFLESSNVDLEAELFELQRLESQRRAILFAMELLMPEMPGIGKIKISPIEPVLLSPRRNRRDEASPGQSRCRAGLCGICTSAVLLRP